MTSVAKKQANNASFQAFMNAYIKEIDTGVWHTKADWAIRTGIQLHQNDKYAVELYLTANNTRLSVPSSYRSTVGRHVFNSVYKQLPNSLQWEEISFMSAILLLIDEIYSEGESGKQSTDTIAEQSLELYARTIESHQIMAMYLENRAGDPALESNQFIDSEQAILFGHWLHPTPKSRQGMHRWQHELFTPELKGNFKLHYFAAKQSITFSNSAETASAFEILENIALCDGAPSTKTLIEELHSKNLKLLAVHPLQADWLCAQAHIQTLLEEGELRHLGELGPLFTPTSSVRTLYNAELDYMVKVSIPVKVTNSLRKNMHHELEAGVTLCRLLKRCGFSKLYPEFKFIDDPAYVSLNAGKAKESGFELILRKNPFNKANQIDGLGGTQSIAALVQDPLFPGAHSRLANIIHSLAQKERIDSSVVATKWLDRYLNCAIEPAIRLFDQCGIALEAHQQNSLLEIADGYPTAYYYRDNQGFYLSKERQQILETMEPQLVHCKDLFYSEQMIINRFTYYLFFNQLFAVINRLGSDQLALEPTLLHKIHGKLKSMLPSLGSLGTAFVTSVLEREKLPFKANLLTRVEDVDELEAQDELAVYVWVNNPFKSIEKLSETSLQVNEPQERSADKVVADAC
ncbi:short-chain oxidoreductase [Alteromonas mediterranea]|uniref:Short-chain oxidoreductase n=1 Tax=Alteromonas mediterranea TaxID=314275 RepID=A0AAC9NS60_9ALTE|nr:IucA/IucC family protein [Alteromonas mediterranea]APD90002.1 short-chain oxidoreductase [Alteromonas mediterranea]